MKIIKGTIIIFSLLLCLSFANAENGMFSNDLGFSSTTSSTESATSVYDGGKKASKGGRSAKERYEVGAELKKINMGGKGLDIDAAESLDGGGAFTAHTVNAAFSYEYITTVYGCTWQDNQGKCAQKCSVVAGSDIEINSDYECKVAGNNMYLSYQYIKEEDGVKKYKNAKCKCEALLKCNLNDLSCVGVSLADAKAEAQDRNWLSYSIKDKLPEDVPDYEGDIVGTMNEIGFFSYTCSDWTYYKCDKCIPNVMLYVPEYFLKENNLCYYTDVDGSEKLYEIDGSTPCKCLEYKKCENKTENCVTQKTFSFESFNKDTWDISIP